MLQAVFGCMSPLLLYLQSLKREYLNMYCQTVNEVTSSFDNKCL